MPPLEPDHNEDDKGKREQEKFPEEFHEKRFKVSGF
jgi:hypothetical protein